MRLLELLYEMTSQEAADIFRRFGGDPAATDLQQVRRALIMKHHPDRGGSLEAAQAINAAYDILSGKSAPSRPSEPSPSYASGGYSSGYGAGRGYTGDPFGFRKQQRRNPNAEREYQKQRSPQTPEWAWAGYSGGLPPNASIYRNDYTDVNFIKKRMWELSGKSKKQYGILGFDGHFFRAGTTVFGSPKIFNEMAKAMIDWQTKGGNPYQCRAVFVTPSKKKELYLIYADGVFYGDKPIGPLTHHSFNLNPGNDRRFMESLPEFLDQLKRGQRPG
jgi:curved DNA-binding protein CbpA